jgi:hypothetical protein
MAAIDRTYLDAGTDKIKLGRAAIDKMARWINTLMGYDSDSMTAPEKVALLAEVGAFAKAGDNMTGQARPWYKNDNAISTTSTFGYDPVANGQVALITLTNAITVTFASPSNIVEGAMYKLILKAGDTSARAFAWNASYKFPSGTPPLTVGTTTNGAKDVITFIGGPGGNTLEYDGHIADNR